MIVQLNLDTLVLHLAEVGPRRGGETDLGGDDTALHEDVFAVLLKHIDLKIESAPQTYFQAEVVLGHSFPCEVGDTYVTFAYAVTTEETVGWTEPVARNTLIDGRDVGETAAVVAEIVITNLTYRSTQFKFIKILREIRHKSLIGKNPSESHRGEEAVALARSEVLRSVVTEIKLSYISGVIGV